MRPEEARIFLCNAGIMTGVSLDTAIGTLRNSQQQKLAFFDSPLGGYVLVPTQPNEQINSIVATFTVLGEESERVLIASSQLTPLLESTEAVLFKFNTLIAFPKTKLENPTVEIQVQVRLSTRSEGISESDVKRLIPSGYPADRRNLLSGLASMCPKSVLLDTVIKDNKVDIVPEPLKEESTKITGESSPQRVLPLMCSVPIIRALNLRVRNVRISKSSVLSTIDIEASSKAKDQNIAVTVNGIEHGFQRTTHPRFTPNFPVSLTDDDSYSFTYLLESHEALNYKSLITINYSCQSHKIVTKLLANIDFITPFSTTHQRSPLLNKSTTSPNPNLATSNLANAINVKFIGTKSVQLGEPFTLTVQIHNVTRKPRNLVMVFNGGNDGYVPQLPKIKSLVLPLQTIMKNYFATRLRPVGILALDNEVHLKADAGAVFETEMRLVGLETGVAPLQGASITDISTGESMSCDKMLEIIVQ